MLIGFICDSYGIFLKGVQYFLDGVLIIRHCKLHALINLHGIINQFSIMAICIAVSLQVNTDSREYCVHLCKSFQASTLFIPNTSCSGALMCKPNPRTQTSAMAASLLDIVITRWWYDGTMNMSIQIKIELFLEK